ncbi:hypothetical protein ACLOJK_026988 [Asimina triloba]
MAIGLKRLGYGIHQLLELKKRATSNLTVTKEAGIFLTIGARENGGRFEPALKKTTLSCWIFTENGDLSPASGFTSSGMGKMEHHN